MLPRGSSDCHIRPSCERSEGGTVDSLHNTKGSHQSRKKVWKAKKAKTNFSKICYTNLLPTEKLGTVRFRFFFLCSESCQAPGEGGPPSVEFSTLYGLKGPLHPLNVTEITE